VRIDPSRAFAYRELGAALLSLERSAEAIGELRAALAIEPASAATHHHLGSRSGRRPDRRGARPSRDGREPGSEDADIQNHWGVALTLAGRRDDAAARFREAVRLRPDDADAQQNLRTSWPGPGRAVKRSGHGSVLIDGCRARSP